MRVVAVLPMHPEAGPREAELAEDAARALGMAVVWHVDSECFVSGVLMGTAERMDSNIRALAALDAFRAYEYAEA